MENTKGANGDDTERCEKGIGTCRTGYPALSARLQRLTIYWRFTPIIQPQALPRYLMPIYFYRTTCDLKLLVGL